jgi:predicted Zn-dependent peptidase
MKNKLLLILLTLIFALPLSAQVDRSKMPAAGPAPEIRIGDYESFVLDNGMKVFVVENDKLPKVTFSLVLDRDPIFEGESAGYVSTTGQLLRTGTKTRTKDQIDEEIDFIGANLFTSATGINTSSLSKHTEKLVELMADIVQSANFKQEELDKIKKQTISNLQTEKDSPGAIASKVRRVLTYGKDHPYGELTNYFGNWAKKEVPTFDYKKVKKPLVRKVALVDRANSVQSTINIVYPVDLKVGSEEAIKASVLNQLFGGGASGRLFQNLREDKGYTYGAYSSLSPDKLVGIFNASADVRNAVTDSAITEFLSEMKTIRSEKVTEKELTDTKNFLIGSFSRSLEQPETIARFALNIERYNLPKDYYKNYLKKLNTVTIDDIHKMAKKYIKPNNAYVVVVGNADEIAGTIKKFSVSGKINYYDIYGEKYDPSSKKIPEGVTVEMVIDNYINALGGRENIEKVTDRTMNLKGSAQGMEVLLTITNKAPNKYFQKLDVGGGMMQQKTVFDGETGKESGMGQEKMLEGKELDRMKGEAILNPFLDFKKHGIQVELTGIETINGKDTYKVTITMPAGNKSTEYYDVESGLVVKQITTFEGPQGTGTSTITFDDYREVEGVKYPFKLTQQFGPQTLSLDVTTIEINQGLDDSMFEVK